jgi:hypothetical protein
VSETNAVYVNQSAFLPKTQFIKLGIFLLFFLIWAKIPPLENSKEK